MTINTSEPTAAAKQATADTSPAYRWYALGLLVVVYVFNFIDRSILGILVQPIKEDLGVSDTAMGFLGGIAFATFYTFLGIPIARMADRGSRRNILAVCLALWSAATALCGLVQNFYQLLAARIGVAVGEAGGSPPSHSMISDMFPPSSRATALGIYALGIPIGTMLGNLGGGWVADSLDWRTAFLLVGLPGVVLAVIVRLTLKEPPRGASEGIVLDTGKPPPAVTDVFAHLWAWAIGYRRCSTVATGYLAKRWVLPCSTWALPQLREHFLADIWGISWPYAIAAGICGCRALRLRCRSRLAILPIQESLLTPRFGYWPYPMCWVLTI